MRYFEISTLWEVEYYSDGAEFIQKDSSLSCMEDIRSCLIDSFCPDEFEK